ncbi:MAG: HDOD domain-containing protein [Candidatus Zixiibacteriota bacterium]
MSSITTTNNSLEKRLEQIIGNIRSLPTPPIVFEQIQKVINSPDASVNDVAHILAEDPAMSVKILKLTNSAFYGLSREIDSISQAVMIIGLEAVKNLVLSASVLSMFKASEETKQYHADFWRHSLTTALVARMIARNFKSGKKFNPDPAFSMGLLHDVGKMIICSFMENEHKQIQTYLLNSDNASDLEAETAVMGFNHAQLGRQLAFSWKLPQRLADTIGYHHSPSLENESDDFAYLISLANYITNTNVVGDNDNTGTKYHLSPEVKDYFEADDDYIAGFKSRIIEEYMKAETFMSIAAKG